MNSTDTGNSTSTGVPQEAVLSYKQEISLVVVDVREPTQKWGLLVHEEVADGIDLFFDEKQPDRLLTATVRHPHGLRSAEWITALQNALGETLTTEVLRISNRDHEDFGVDRKVSAADIPAKSAE